MVDSQGFAQQLENFPILLHLGDPAVAGLFRHQQVKDLGDAFFQQELVGDFRGPFDGSFISRLQEGVEGLSKGLFRIESSQADVGYLDHLGARLGEHQPVELVSRLDSRRRRQ